VNIGSAFPPDLIVRSQRVVTPSGIRPASVHIRGGKIIGVLEFSDVPTSCPIDEGGRAVIIPGLVDTHVHVGDSGSDSEELEKLTRAAAAGGITTLIAMLQDSGVARRTPSRFLSTTTAEGVAATLDAAEGHCHVDVGFWGGAVPGNAHALAPMLDAGVFGFTCGLLPSIGQAVSEADLRIAMPAIARLRVPLLVHAEVPGPIERAAERRLAAGTLARVFTARRSRRSYRAYLESRPKEAENEAIRLMIALCQEFRTQIHIVHLSSSDALTPLFHARSARLPITAETCPHYLSFVAEEIPDGATVFKCAPPIRERENREFLWAALAGGLIQMVVSDHAPASEAAGALSGDFRRAWTGIPSLELSLSAMLTGAVGREYTLNQVADWMCRMPARLAGLDRKGAIEPGYDADLVVFDTDAEFTVEAETLHQDRRTPYVGKRLRGIVERTYLRGHRIYERGRVFERPAGRVLARKR
jgi:allantoinase